MITLKPPSEFGADTMVGRIPGRLAGESLDQLITNTADLKITEDALAEDTAAFEDTMQDCLAIQTKAAKFEAYTNKSLSEELEALAKAKAVISEKGR